MMIELDFTITSHNGDWACTMDGRILVGHSGPTERNWLDDYRA